MGDITSWLFKTVKTISLLLVLGGSVSACAATSWKEEVLLHDGSKIIVMRTAERGGRQEIGQRPPIKNQTLIFTMPETGKSIKWEDRYSEDIGSASFLPMLLDILNGKAYLVASPMGCLSYNKWGRPNPPYVIFQYENDQWERIALQELPAEFKLPNLIISSPDDRAKKEEVNGIVSAEKITEMNAGFKQPEYHTILREALPDKRIKEMCEERVLYKGNWILPNDPIARQFIDRQQSK
ncbi:MAG: hypothetical protein ACAH12_01450 [Methylophilaceae bacterium]